MNRDARIESRHTANHHSAAELYQQYILNSNSRTEQWSRRTRHTAIYYEVEVEESEGRSNRGIICRVENHGGGGLGEC